MSVAASTVVVVVNVVVVVAVAVALSFVSKTNLFELKLCSFMLFLTFVLFFS